VFLCLTINSRQGWSQQTYDEQARFLELCPITLTLPRTPCSQEDVFDRSIYVFFPGGKPGNGVVMLDLWLVSGNPKGKSDKHTPFHFPGMFGMGSDASLPMLMMMSSGRNRYCIVMRRCNRGMLETHLQGPLLRVLSAASEQARRFRSEVSSLLLPSVDHGE